MIKIYKLVKDGKIVYVGKTKLSLSRRKGGAYYCMDKDFVSKCDIELIEETNDVSRERYWIEYYIKKGYELKNKRNGDYDEESRRYSRRINTSKQKKRGRPKTNTKEDVSKKKKEWYEKNKDRINKQRREQYRIDPWYKKIKK